MYDAIRTESTSGFDCVGEMMEKPISYKTIIKNKTLDEWLVEIEDDKLEK